MAPRRKANCRSPKQKRASRRVREGRRPGRSAQTERDAGSKLLELLLRLYSSAKLSALEFCQ
eukprot:7681633-Pyramimonas_sp.AAC.1